MNEEPLLYDKYGYWDYELNAWVPYDDMGDANA